jgi:FixJ family two-component response regulator
MTKRALIVIVDDDESVRESLPDLLDVLGHEAMAYASAEAYLESDRLADTSCLLLDLVMPGMSGTDLQRELARQKWEIPIVFLTADVRRDTRQRLRALGAVDCLLKPFNELQLVDALNMALQGRAQ